MCFQLPVLKTFQIHDAKQIDKFNSKLVGNGSIHFNLNYLVIDETNQNE